MCGIFCSVSRRRYIAPSRSVKQLLQARGPDATNSLELPRRHGSAKVLPAFVTFHASVLSLRSLSPVSQPIQVGDVDSILCWNGEAWSVRGSRLEGSDTDQILVLLQHAVHKARSKDHMSFADAVSRALSQVSGPYAFVFFEQTTSTVYFGRDFLGRRSLLWSITEEGDILLSSVSDADSSHGWIEVEADGVYGIDLSGLADHGEGEQRGNFLVSKVPYFIAREQEDEVASAIPELHLNRHIPSIPAALHGGSSSVAELERFLRMSLSLRISNIPEPPFPKSTRHDRRSSSIAKVAVLFSGGLDCTVLARLSSDLMLPAEPIDLLNVAFENPRIHKSKGEAAYELCPDRITGRAAFAELTRVCPGRKWQFIAINIPYVETQEHRQQVIDLIYPHNTEMDLSIAYALYFAARGIGLVSSDHIRDEPLPYTTPSRVLLSGLGADELFAGYTRHATAFNRSGFDGLLDELDLDIRRLGSRNLGRDDRVISHWGKEVRFPFLDEQLIRWALTVPVTDKCDFGRLLDEDNEDSSASIEPSKKVLRCLAWKLGMTNAAREKKRAIQFGARTAKMETGRIKGTTLLQ